MLMVVDELEFVLASLIILFEDFEEAGSGENREGCRKGEGDGGKGWLGE